MPFAEWLSDHQALLWWLGGSSLLMFVGTLVVVPVLVARIPADYFTAPRRGVLPWHRRHPILRLALLAGKNLAGAVFLAAGLAMLFLPGQGLVTMLVGVVLLDFPGKFALERWIIRRRPVARAVNWLRARAGRPPLEIPDAHGVSSQNT